MRIKLIAVLAGAVLALAGVVTLVPEQAEAAEVAEVVSAAPVHVFDNAALWYCQKHAAAGFVILHATPYFLSSTQVRYYCRMFKNAVHYQYWVIVNMPLESNVSWRPWAYQRCHPGGIVTCLEP